MSQAQLYQSLRGLTTPGPDDSRVLVAPGGREYAVEALPLAVEEPPAGAAACHSAVPPKNSTKSARVYDEPSGARRRAEDMP